MSAKRGPYRKCYLVPHGRGFKYLRAIPKDLQVIEQKKVWVKCLGPVSRPMAETMAHALAHEHGMRILAFREQAPGGQCAKPTPERSREVAPFLPCVPHETAEAELSMSHMVALWEKVRSPRSAAGKAKIRRCVRRFHELVGRVPAREVARSHAVAYRDALEALSWMKSKNVTEHLESLHVIFAVALSEGLLEQNPFSNIKAREKARAFSPRREGFTAARLASASRKGACCASRGVRSKSAVRRPWDRDKRFRASLP